MSRFDGNIIVGTSVDVGGINTGLNKITGAFNKLARHISNSALTKLFSDAASAASDLVEVQNVVDVTFEDMSWKAERFAKNAIEQFGMSELAAKQTAGSFMAMGKAADLGMKNASNMAVNLAALTGDFASFYNISQEYARVALSAVYTGETETLKRYGIILTEANLQAYAETQNIQKNVKLMNAREKLILRYMYVMDKTKDIQGDFVRTQESFANQTRLLGQSWKQFLIVLGNGVTTVMAPVLKMLGLMLVKLRQFTQLVLSIIGNLFHIDFSQVGENMKGYADDVDLAAEAEEDLADNIGKATKAAWKAVAPFDELNILRTPSAGSGGKAGGADIFAGFNADELYKFPEINEDILKSTIDTWYDFGKWLSDGFANILDKINWDAIFKKAKEFGKNLADFLNGIFQPKNFYKAGKTLANALNTIIHAAFEFATNLDWEQVGLSIANYINGFAENFEWEKAGKTIKAIVRGVEKLVRTVIKNVNWKKLISGIFTLLKEIPWEVYLAILLGLIGKLIKKLFTSIIGPVIRSCVMAALTEAFKDSSIYTWFQGLLGKLFGTAGAAGGGAAVSGIARVAGETMGEDFAWAFTNTAEEVITDAPLLTDSSTLIDKGVYGTWREITEAPNVSGWQKIGAVFKDGAAFFGTLNTSSVSSIFAGEMGAAGIGTAIGEMIIAAIGGYFLGKEVVGPKILAPEDSDFYEQFKWFGDEGFFSTIFKNFSSLGDAINNMYTDIDGIARRIDPIKSLFLSVVNLFKADDAESAGKSMFTTMEASLGTVIPPLTLVQELLQRFLPEDVKQKVEDWFTGMGQMFVDFKTKVVDFFTNIWGKVSGFFTNLWGKIKNIWGKITGFFKGLWEDFTTYIVDPIVNGVKGIWDKLYPSIKAIVDKVKEIVETIGHILKGFWIVIKAAFIVAWEFIKDKFTALWDFIKDKFNTLKQWFTTYILEPIKKLFTKIKEKFIELKDAIVEKAIEIKDKLVEKFTEIKDKVVAKFTEIKDWIVQKFTEIKDWFITTFVEPIKQKFEEIREWVVTKFQEIRDKIIEKFTEARDWFIEHFVEPVKKKALEIYTYIKDNIIDPFKQKWETAIENIKGFFTDLWDNIKNGCKSMVNSVLTWIENMLNKIIDGINSLVLGGFNKIVSKAAAITGDKWEDVKMIDHVTIPKLAKGAVIPPNSPFLALLGDQKRGTNVETPLDTIKQAVVEAMASGGFGIGGDINVVCVLDGREIARAVVKQNDIAKKSRGVGLFV